MPTSTGLLLIFCGDFKATLLGGGKIGFDRVVYYSEEPSEIKACNCPACEFAPGAPMRGGTTPPIDMQHFAPRKVIHVWGSIAEARRWKLHHMQYERSGEAAPAFSMVGNWKICGIFAHKARVDVAVGGRDWNTEYGRPAAPGSFLFLFSSDPSSVITFLLCSVPHRIENLVLVTRSGCITTRLTAPAGPFCNHVFDHVQVANLLDDPRYSNVDDCLTAVWPLGMYAAKMTHWATNMCVLKNGVRPITRIPKTMFWLSRDTWVRVEEPVGDRVVEEAEESGSEVSDEMDGFIVSDAEAQDNPEATAYQDEFEPQETPPPDEEEAEEDGSDQDGEELDSLDHSQPEVYVPPQRRATTKKRALDATAEVLLSVDPSKRVANERTKKMCVICLAEESVHLIVPCGHVVFCDACYRHPKLNRTACPVCKQPPKVVMSVDMHAEISSMIVYWS